MIIRIISVVVVTTLLFTTFANKGIIFAYAEEKASTDKQKNPTKKELSSKSQLIFFDDFNYVVGKNDPDAVTLFKTKGGWWNAKTLQTNGGGANGFLYTVDQIPGYSGNFPGRNSKRVLAIEALPSTYGFQTSFQLTYGDISAPKNTIPGNVWFQFWIYPNYYGDQLSKFNGRNKFIYPCNGTYPCHTNKWLLETGSYSHQPHNNYLGKPSTKGMYLFSKDNMIGNIKYSRADSWDASKIGQSNINDYIAVNRWTLVKIHYDTSSIDGTFEAWLKPKGGDWIKVVEWISGVTPYFSWKIPTSEVGGHRVFSMPTTIPGGGKDALFDSWIYLDDFAMAMSENDLPKYSE